MSAAGKDKKAANISQIFPKSKENSQPMQIEPRNWTYNSILESCTAAMAAQRFISDSQLRMNKVALFQKPSDDLLGTHCAALKADEGRIVAPRAKSAVLNSTAPNDRSLQLLPVRAPFPTPLFERSQERAACRFAIGHSEIKAATGECSWAPTSQ